MLGNQPPGFMILPTEAGTRVETSDRYLDRGGPEIDHLAQLIRRQRRRRALRRLLTLGRHPQARRLRAATQPATIDEKTEAQWGWLTDGDVRRLLAERDPARSTPPPVLDLRTPGRGASRALDAIPRQGDRRHEREPVDRGPRRA